MGKYVAQTLAAEEIPGALRKLRKKLRQIEHLEHINNRVLTREEEDKVASKDEIRSEILRLTGQQNEQNLITLAQDDPPVLPSTKLDANTGKCCWENVLARMEEIVVSTINGHNDIIYDVAADDEYIVTCSRDTMVKAWDSITGEEVCTLRQHTSGVSAVLLLTRDQGDEVANRLNLKDKHRIAITGGYDCMICVWSITKGDLLKSAYVYNNVTCMTLIESTMRLLLGTDGGKIELWDVFGLQLLNSLLTYEDTITKIQVVNELAYIANSDGTISVLRIMNDSIVCLYSSDNVELAVGDGLNCIHTLQVNGEDIYYGDDGASVKVLNWRTGVIRKISNHCKNYGSTDALFLTENEVVASSYNIDMGSGSLNVFKVPENEYIGSLSDDETGRILSIVVVRNSEGHPRVISVGSEFKIWDSVAHGGDTKLKVDRQKRIGMHRLPAHNLSCQDSDIDNSESASGSSESENYGDGRFAQLYFPQEVKPTATSLFAQWCNIL